MSESAYVSRNAAFHPAGSCSTTSSSVMAAAESLLLGKVVGIVQGCEIGDSFFCFFPTIRINDLDPNIAPSGASKKSIMPFL